MSERMIDTSPQRYARIAGALYLVNIVCGLFGEAVVRGRLVVAGDAAATAHHIMSSELLFRAGIVGDLVMHLSDVPMAVIFYFLLRPVSRDMSLLASLFGLMQTALLLANKLSLVTVLLLLGGGKDLQAFTPAQLNALASMSLAQHEIGFGVGLVFFGVSCLFTGYLMYRSGYFPRTLGVLQGLAGVSYLINSLALLLFPPVAAKLFPWIVLPAFVGELGTCVWLLVRGIDVVKWRQAVASGKDERMG